MNDTNANPTRVPAWRRVSQMIAARWVLFACLAVPTGIALFYAVENFRGTRAWNNYRKEAEARGLNLSFAAHIPAPVPDAENGALTPWVQSWFPKPRANPDPFWPELKTKAEQRITRRKPDGQRHFTDLVAWKDAIESTIAAGETKSSKKFPERDRESAERMAVAPIVLNALVDYRPALDELRAASKKPRVRYPVDYRLDDPYAILLPHLAKIKAAVSVLGLQSSAELALNKSDDAFHDVLLMLWLAESLREEPFLINQLVRVACLQITTQTVWEGVAQQRWTDAQLKEFQAQFAKLDFFSSLNNSLSAERAGALLAIDQMRKRNAIKQILGPEFTGSAMSEQWAWEFLPWLAPRGWFRLETVNYCRAMDTQLLKAIDSEKRMIDKDRVSINTKRVEKDLGKGSALFLQHKMATKLLLPAVGTAARKFALGQVNADEAAVACAVERYRLARGKLPETLDVLVPDFMAKIPHDVLAGGPLQYRRLSDKEFSLSSVGWPKEEVDGGQRPFGWTDTQRSDWVWQSAVP